MAIQISFFLLALFPLHPILERFYSSIIKDTLNIKVTYVSVKVRATEITQTLCCSINHWLICRGYFLVFKVIMGHGGL
jgi:hypothetical protein